MFVVLIFFDFTGNSNHLASLFVSAPSSSLGAPAGLPLYDVGQGAGTLVPKGISSCPASHRYPALPLPAPAAPLHTLWLERPFPLPLRGIRATAPRLVGRGLAPGIPDCSSLLARVSGGRAKHCHDPVGSVAEANTGLCKYLLPRTDVP